MPSNSHESSCPDLSALQHLAVAASERRPLDEVLRVALDLAIEITHSDSGLITLQPADQRTFSVPVSRGLPIELIGLIHQRAVTDSFLLREMLERQLPILVADTADSKMIPEIRAAVLRAGVNSFVIVPLRVADRIIGTLTLGKRSRGGFADVPAVWLETMGHLVAVAIEADQSRRSTEQAESQVRTQVRYQDVIASLGWEYLSTLDVNRLLDQTVELISATLGVDLCKVLWLDPDGKTLTLRAGRGWQPGLVGNAKVPASIESQAGYTLMRREPVVVTDFADEMRFAPPELLVSHGVRAGASVPMIVGGRPVGVLGIHQRTPRTFQDAEVRFLVTVAQFVCLAVEHQTSLDEVHWRNEHLTRLERLTITFWTQTSAEQLYNAVAGTALQVLEGDIAAVALIEDRHKITYVAAVGDGFLKGLSLPLSDCPVSDWMASRGKPLLITDMATDWHTQRGVWPQLDATSLIAAPLESQGMVVGLVAVVARSRVFNHVQLQMLHLLAHQASVALAKIRLDEELRQSRDRLNEWLGHLHRLSELGSEELALQRSVETLCEVLHARYGAIGILGENGELANFVHTGVSQEEAARIGPMPTGKGLLGMLLADPHPLRLADLTRHPHHSGFPPDHPAMKTFLGLPITTGSGQVLGRVYLTEKKGGEPFTAEDEAIAMHFAHSLAVAIENARLYNQTRTYADSVLALQHQTARLRGYKALSDIYAQVLTGACAVVPADIAVLPLLSEDGSALQYVAAQGPNAESLLNRTVPISVPNLCSEAIKRGESVSVADLSKEPHLDQQLVEEFGIRSGLCVPLVRAEHVIGAVTLLRKEKNFSPLEAQVLSVLGNHAAEAIEKARLFGRIRAEADFNAAMLQAVTRIVRGHDMESYLRHIVEAARELVGSRYAAIGMLGVDQRFERFIHTGLSTEQVERIGPLPTGRGVLRTVIRSREPIRMGDMSQSSDSVGFPAQHPPMKSMLGVPMRCTGDMFGILYLTEKIGADEFTEEDERRAVALAAHATLAIEHARLHVQAENATKLAQQHAEQLQIAYGELQSAQEQIIQQERLRAVGQMASGVAHDLNNTLTPILGYADMLLRDPQLPEALRERLELIQTAGQDAAAVVKRLQLFYQPQTSSELSQTVGLVELVRQIPELTRPKWRDEAQHTGRTIEVELDLCDIALVRGNAHELREVLTNLVFNAVDAMPSGGQITLRVRATDETVCVEVADTGTGMTDEVRLHCFEPFFTTKGSSGTGLGLSICHGIIQRHGGTIEIDTAPGKGTTFRINLPLASANQAVTPGALSRPLPQWRILYIDDDPRVRQVIAGMLERLGQHVDLAESGAAGLTLLRSNGYDLVITDLGMPEISGNEVTSVVKELHPDTPVILLTGWGESPGVGLPPAANPDYTLGKPVSLATLYAALENLLPQSRPE